MFLEQLYIYSQSDLWYAIGALALLNVVVFGAKSAIQQTLAGKK